MVGVDVMDKTARKATHKKALKKLGRPQGSRKEFALKLVPISIKVLPNVRRTLQQKASDLGLTVQGYLAEKLNNIIKGEN